MSNLIASLVARASGEVPVLEPRLPSRFEPDARGDPAVADEAQAGIDMLRAEPQPQPQPESTSPAPAPLVRADAQPAPRAGVSTPPGPPASVLAAPLSVLAVPAQSGPVQVQAPEAPHELAPQTAGSRQGRAAVSARFEPGPDPRRIGESGTAAAFAIAGVAPPQAGDGLSLARPRGAQIAPRPIPQVASVRRTAQSSPTTPAKGSVAQPLPHREAVRHVDRPAAPYAVPVSIARSEPQPSPAAAPATPTVHVTIGRVEVRAMPAPASPPAARNRQAALSLEQFLAQQGPRGKR